MSTTLETGLLTWETCWMCLEKVPNCTRKARLVNHSYRAGRLFTNRKTQERPSIRYSPIHLYIPYIDAYFFFLYSSVSIWGSSIRWVVLMAFLGKVNPCRGEYL
jgi:hypothetical protein